MGKRKHTATNRLVLFTKNPALLAVHFQSLGLVPTRREDGAWIIKSADGLTTIEAHPENPVDKDRQYTMFLD